EQRGVERAEPRADFLEAREVAAVAAEVDRGAVAGAQREGCPEPPRIRDEAAPRPVLGRRRGHTQLAARRRDTRVLPPVEPDGVCSAASREPGAEAQRGDPGDIRVPPREAAYGPVVQVVVVVVG